MPRTEAELVDWDDQRGFGFARLPGGSERIFVHIKSLNPRMPRPKTGDQLEFEVVSGRKGRPAAQAVDIISPNTGVSSPLSLHLATAAMLLILLQINLMLGQVPLWLASLYVSMGAVSMIAYSWDKKAARLGLWRIRESRLLLIDLAGGVIGGLIAQHIYRHKRSKQSYQAMMVGVIVFHAALLGAMGAGFINLVS
jgi:uncharacterized membrane protein YsdA (DUF1294 family)/cold shock CspA family protein